MKMATYSTRELQEEFLGMIRKGQETVIEAVRTWVETVQAVTPKVPSVQLPLADKLPRPEDAVDNAYDFAEKLLASQRHFSEELLKTAAPLLPGDGIQKEQRKPAATAAK